MVEHNVSAKPIVTEVLTLTARPKALNSFWARYWYGAEV